MKNRSAFTLVECIAALGLFALISVVLGQTCFNCLNAVHSLKKDAYNDALFDYLRTKVLAEDDLSVLQTGLDVYGPDGKTLTIIGDAAATRIVDLFRLDVSCDEAGYSDVFYLVRPSWYDKLTQVSVQRDEILDDRKDEVEDARRRSAWQ